MANSFSPFGFVKKSGDVMTGDLNLGLNSLILNNGINGGELRGNPVAAEEVQVRTIGDGGFGDLKMYGAALMTNITMQPGRTVDGVDISERGYKTGTYVGDGNDLRSIDIGIDLASMTNVYIVVKTEYTGEAVHRIEYAQGDATMHFTGKGDIPNLIQGLTATGFELGSDDIVNKDGETYRYIVFWN